MENASEWHNCIRVFHFLGGLRGINPPGDKVYFDTNIQINPEIIEKLNNYHSFHELTDTYGSIIGVEFYEHKMQTEGLIPPFWRMHHYQPQWLCTQLIQELSEIRHAAFKDNNLEFVDSVAKIHAWVEATSRSLKNISNAYSNVLCRKKCNDTDKDELAFDDMNCDEIFDSIHIFLYYIGTLRDHIAEFIEKYIATELPPKIIKSAKMHPLAKFLETSTNDHNLKGLKKDILDAYDMSSDYHWPGWLSILSDYRNVITHERPVQLMNHRAWVWRVIKSTGQHKVATIKFPIPGYPFSFDVSFPASPCDILEEKHKMFVPSVDFMRTNPDGLEFCWLIFDQLLKFLSKVLLQSPVLPVPIILNQKDYWGFTINSSQN